MTVSATEDKAAFVYEYNNHCGTKYKNFEVEQYTTPEQICTVQFKKKSTNKAMPLKAPESLIVAFTLLLSTLVTRYQLLV